MMNKFLDRYSIRWKIIFSLFPFLVLSYFLLFGNSIYGFFSETKKTVENEQVQNAIAKKKQLNHYMYNLNSMFDQILYGSVVQEYLGSSIDANYEAFSDICKDLTAEFESINDLYSSFPTNIYLEPLSASNTTYYINHDISFQTLAEYQKKKELLLKETRQRHGKMTFYYSANSPAYLTITKTIYKPDIKNIDQELGFYMCDIYLGEIKEILSSQNPDISRFLLVLDNKFIINDAANLADIDISELGADGYSNSSGQKYHYVRYETDYPQLLIYNVVNENLLYKDAYHNLYIQLGIILCSVIVIIYAIYYTSNIISQQFHTFIDKLSHTNNTDSSAYINISTKDEFQELALAYNNMLSRIICLNQKIINQKLLKNEAELKALQAQINPHFLYNTLDCITVLIDIQKYEEAQTSLLYLGTLMRMAIKGEDILTVEKEMQYVQQYMYIQKLRFGKKLLYLSDVPQSLYSYSIPKLCIQPLLENAIIHGISTRKSEGMIALLGYEQEDIFFLEIKDNGIPIPADIIEQVRAVKIDYSLETDALPREKIGLINIQKRIKYLYGTAYGIDISYNQSGGNTVTVKLPKKKEGQKNEDTDCG